MNDLTLFQGENLTALEKVTGYLSKSSLVPNHYRGKQAEIFSAVILGHDLGLSPMQSLLEIHVINGRPAMSTKLMLAMVKRAYPTLKMRWDKKPDSVTLHFQLSENDQVYTTTWDIGRASKLNLMNRDQYKKQLETMLSWRCLSEAIRFCAPEAVLGFYSIDEAQDTEQESDEERMYKQGKSDNELELGNPEYIFPDRKFRGKKMKDVSEKELLERYDYLESKTQKKNYVFDQKDFDEMQSIKIYTESLE